MIHIIDEIMGAGKTSAAINYMNSNKDKKFIYITPYLDEVERIKQNCNFEAPVNYNYNPMTKKGISKIVDLKRLLGKGSNIVTTHALFNNFDDETIDLCYANGYELIMDEVHEVVSEYNINKEDLNLLLSKWIKIDENGNAIWVGEENYTGKFEEIKNLCTLGALSIYSGIAMLWMFPIKVFEAFREVYILTYMFDGQIQKYYYIRNGSSILRTTNIL